MMSDAVRVINECCGRLLDSVPGHNPFWALAVVVGAPILIAIVVGFLREVVFPRG
jgi:hypothetical protein